MNKIYDDISLKGHEIYDVKQIWFNNNPNNFITDTTLDLNIHGDTGMSFALSKSTGGIWVESCSTFRPKETASNISLGANWARWKEIFVGVNGINFDDGTTQTTAGSGGSWVGTATSDLHMGYYDIYDIQFLRWDGWLSINFDGSTLKPTYDCIIDLGGHDNNFDTIRCDRINGNLNSSYCDVGELQFVDEDCEPGTIVELHDWENKGEEELFNKELEDCMEKKDCNIRFYGLQGRWKKASKNSIKCPSVVSTAPAAALGTSINRDPYYQNGKMNYIALSGSVPNVFVEGKFKSGDILVSAGNGKAIVNNDAKWNQALGYTKRSGENERCEIWVR